MKRLSTITTLCLMIAIMALTSCTQGKSRTEIMQAAAELNKQCPASCNDGSTLIGATVENQHFILNYTCDPKDLDIAKFEGHTDLIKKLYLLDKVGNKDFSEMATKLINADYQLDVYFCNTDMSSNSSFTVSIDELKHFNMTQPSNEETLDTYIEVAKLDLPTRVDKGVNFTDIVKDASNVTFVYEIDESLYNIKDIKSILKEMKESTSSSFSSDDDPTFVPIVETDRGLVFRYIGKKSGNTAEYSFTNDELRVLTHNVMIKK